MLVSPFMPARLSRFATVVLLALVVSAAVAESAVVALLGQSGRPLTAEQLDRLEKLIARAKKNGGRL